MPRLFKLIETADEIIVEQGIVAFEIERLFHIGIMYSLRACGGDFRWNFADQEVQLIDGKTSVDDVNGEAVKLSFVMVTKRPMVDTDLVGA